MDNKFSWSLQFQVVLCMFTNCLYNHVIHLPICERFVYVFVTLFSYEMVNKMLALDINTLLEIQFYNM